MIQSIIDQELKLKKPPCLSAIKMGGMVYLQVKIDGAQIDESIAGERKRTKKLTIQPGEKLIKLTGITVPDQRATYFICFSSNVDVLSRRTSQKVDFPAGEQFEAELVIKVNSEPVSEPINCNYYSLQSKNIQRLNVD